MKLVLEKGDYLKKFEIFFSKVLIQISYIFTYLIPIKKNRVSLISYFNNEYGLEFEMLVKLLKEDNYEIKASLHCFNGTMLGKLRYLFSFMYQTYLFNTSSVVLLDGNNFVYANIKVKAQVHTIQLWHATGAIKKFGQDTKRRYQIKGYDSIIVSSSFFKPIYAQALNTPLENVHDLGICKTDYLFDCEYLNNCQVKFYQKYPFLKNKKIILYAPTFRGEGIDDINDTSNINELTKLLNDDYCLLKKNHPLVKKNDNDTSIIDVSSDDLYELLVVADYVISDYSALIFDAMILNKKTILYLYDYQEYKKNRDFCVNIHEIDLKKGYTIHEIYDILNEYEDCEEVSANMEKYLSAIDGSSTKRIFNYIKNLERMRR
ncbi:CDP-glycerol glycerophosphotransferase family protein [Erysipelotrichaceae bacterium OttesenSCG-928-M19]|nr:CDP-glycerol glycerophosphotransferase family protein [Erysipelotrichaceae bacterium OttesenSCG-928-M19]